MIRILEFCLPVIYLFTFSYCQNSTANYGWRKSGITKSQEDQIAIANAAIDAGIGFLQPSGALPDPGFGPNDTINLTGDDFDLIQRWADTFIVPNSSLLLSQMAEYDLITGQTKYRDRLRGYFANVSPSDDMFLYGLLEYGYAAARAYAAYKDTFFLELAQSIWTIGRNYTVTEVPQVLSSFCPQRVVPDRTVNDPRIAGEVDNTSSVVGGTSPIMRKAGEEDGDIVFSSSTGQFLLLSALLAEATPSNETYLKAANQSAHFLRVFSNPISGAVAFHTFGACNETLSLYPGGAFSGSSFLLEALAILLSITHDEPIRATWQLTLQNLVTSATSFGTGSNVDTPRVDGIMQYPGNPYVVRGLAQAYKRKVLSPALADFAKQYIGVQYNALIDLAAFNGSNTYSANWVGPPPPSGFQLMGVKGVNQSIAATVLVSSIGLGDEPLAGRPRSSSKTIIIASVLSTLAFVAIISLVGLFWYRRRRHRKFSKKPDVDVYLTYPKPYREGGSLFNVSEKHQPGRPGDESSSEKSTLKTSGGVNNTNPRGIGPGGGPIQASGEMSTEELVRMLNQRLQPEQWNTDEIPPDYSHSSAGGSSARSRTGAPSNVREKQIVGVDEV